MNANEINTSEINTNKTHDVMFPSDILHGDILHADEHPISSDRHGDAEDQLFTQMMQNSKDAMPPAPPDEDDVNLVTYPCEPDFSFIADDDTKNMISSAYDCVMNEEDAWQNIKNFRGESYMFSKDTKINQLMNDIDSVYGGHSGASIGWTMRQIERVAHIGFDKFKHEWNNK